MSETRDRIYAFICDYARTHAGRTPSRREIAEGTNLASTSTIQYHLEIMDAEGRIVLGGMHTPRNIELPGATWSPPEDSSAK